MKSTKEEATKILDNWYQKVHYFEHNRYCTNHKEFKKLLGNPILSDRELILEINRQAQTFIIQNNIKLIDCISEELKKDKELVLELVKTQGYNLTLLKNDFRDDEDIVWAALKSSSDTFIFVSDRLKDKDTIVKYALKNVPKNISYASDRFRNDKELMSDLLKKHEYLLKDVHDDLRNDMNILLIVWDTIKEKSADNNTYLAHKSAVFLKDMGDKIKPLFNQVNQKSDISNKVKQIDSVFSHFFLSKELNSNNIHQSKKIKL